jgi:hypothetical protein
MHFRQNIINVCRSRLYLQPDGKTYNWTPAPPGTDAAAPPIAPIKGVPVPIAGEDEGKNGV